MQDLNDIYRTFRSRRDEAQDLPDVLEGLDKITYPEEPYMINIVCTEDLGTI